MSRPATPSTLTRREYDPPLVLSVTAWDGTPADQSQVSWSELDPPMLPVQTVVTVEISYAESVIEGVAGLTRYLELQRASAGSSSTDEESLADWTGVEAATFGTRLRRSNPYDPVAGSLFVVVQLAIADALGKLSDLPASVYFGGACRSSVAAYASLPSFSHPEEAVDCALSAYGEGFTAIKFHASGLVDTDVETIAAARSRLGPNVALLWDANCSYELESALTVAEALVSSNFLWFEAPFADDQGALLRRLRARNGVALLPDGMSRRSVDDWLRDINEGIWDDLRFDVTYAPTLAHALRLLRLAEVLGVHCEIQSFGFPLTQYANLQLMLATPTCRFFEAPYPAVDLSDELAEPPPIVDGRVHAPTEPGLGHTVTLEDVARNTRLIARYSVS
jgi:L-alanine-DL-glutamate epimerase-like enolase superfamily enzyme